MVGGDGNLAHNTTVVEQLDCAFIFDLNKGVVAFEVEDAAVVPCFGVHLGGGVPGFECVKTSEQTASKKPSTTSGY
jgi:hypothetical protein